MNFGLNGKLKTLLDRLSATRAGYMDAAISSRASSSTISTAKTDIVQADSDIDTVDAAYAGVRNSRYGTWYQSTGSSANHSIAALTDYTKVIINNDVSLYSSTGFSGYVICTSNTNVHVNNSQSSGFVGGFSLIELY
ncbi:MAG: hypothetical protein QM479_16070 [Pseudomonadota bacterium]